MLSPSLELLLILQDRDSKRLGVEAQLKAVPAEIAAIERTVAAENSAIEAARGEQRLLEVQKKDIEIQIGSANDRLNKYRTQQSAVRKNEEYQALGHEIETTQTLIGDLEGKELELMYSIDEAKKRFIAAENVAKSNITGYNTRIAGLREREKNLKLEIETAKKDVELARVPVPVPAVRIYDRLLARNMMPIVGAIRGGKCGGCHLKVSSDADSASRGSSAIAEIANCDQCGRIIYFES
jgi:predicted  nucleic acid-binding Zn-ribbon protein